MKKKRSSPLSNKKIIYIHKSGRGWGGAQQNLYDLIDHFKNEFGETVFLCNDGLLLEKIEILKVKSYKIPIKSVKYFPITLLILAKILIREKPDIIHSNHRYATLLVQLLRVIFPLRYKILHTARSVFTTKTKCRLLGDRIIANSEAIRKNLIDKFHITPEKIEVIYDGVELKMNNPICLSQQNDPVFQLLDTSPKIIIGCIGSLVIPKGHEYLLQAIAVLPKAVQENILVLIVGEGPLRKKLETYAQAANLTEVVKFLGYRADVHHIMSYCHFLVIPSIQEGLPNVLIEGYLLGKASIVSELDYVQEILIPNKCSLTFPSRDVKKLAEALQVYIENPGLASRHGAKGRGIFKRMFNLKKNLKNYRLAYQHLLEME
ncbi:MAG: glycosyltransferase family 4 protein [Gammaproteobacteria bacterium]|nr:glycosyltransferase family 4 protein [Gammaproteobacteria bacterium]